MSRRRSPAKLKIIPDAKYNNVVISKFINYLMLDGKKYVAESIAYQAIDSLAAQTKKNPVVVFEEVVESLKPMVEVRSKRIGGSTYQIPVEVKPERQLFKSLKWIIESAKKRGGGHNRGRSLLDIQREFERESRIGKLQKAMAEQSLKGDFLQ